MEKSVVGFYIFVYQIKTNSFLVKELRCWESFRLSAKKKRRLTGFVLPVPLERFSRLYGHIEHRSKLYDRSKYGTSKFNIGFASATSGGRFRGAGWVAAHPEKSQGGQNYLFAIPVLRGGPFMRDGGPEALHPANNLYFQFQLRYLN